MIPNKWLSLPSEDSEGTSNFTKPKYKTPVVVGKSQKLLHLVNSGRRIPILHRLNFALFDGNTLTRHNMTKKIHFLKEQMTLSVLEIQLVFGQNIKNTVQKLFMLFYTLRVE